MQFLVIPIGAAATDMPDPRTSPADVPNAAIQETPKTLTNTDEQPPVCVLTLEGTAGQDCEVQQYVLDEQTKNATPADRKFYAVGAAPVTVVVGVVSLVRAYPGEVYYRITGAPAAAATLKIGFKSGVPA